MITEALGPFSPKNLNKLVVIENDLPFREITSDLLPGTSHLVITLSLPFCRPCLDRQWVYISIICPVVMGKALGEQLLMIWHDLPSLSGSGSGVCWRSSPLLQIKAPVLIGLSIISINDNQKGKRRSWTSTFIAVMFIIVILQLKQTRFMDIQDLLWSFGKHCS